jgi:hypothetical protein
VANVFSKKIQLSKPTHLPFVPSEQFVGSKKSKSTPYVPRERFVNTFSIFYLPKNPTDFKQQKLRVFVSSWLIYFQKKSPNKLMLGDFCIKLLIITSTAVIN